MGEIKNISGSEKTLYAKAINGKRYSEEFAVDETKDIPDIFLTTSPQVADAIANGVFEVITGAANVIDKGIKTTVTNFSALPDPAGYKEGDLVLVAEDEGPNQNGLYKKESSDWVFFSDMAVDSASEVGNDSGVTGATVKDALDNMQSDIDTNATHATGDGTDHANVVLNDTHRAADGKDHSDVVQNNNHRTGDGSDHANVAVNDAHVAGDGSDHADVAANSVHSGGDGSDHANVALNDAHRASDGKDHSDVVANNSHVAGDGSDHANVALNDAHRTGDGTDHSAMGAYTPAVTGDWSSSNPANVAAALDRIAAAIGPIA